MAGSVVVGDGALPAASRDPAPLVVAARRTAGLVRALAAHVDGGEADGAAPVATLAASAAGIEARLDRPELVVAVIGEKKVGKSTLLNAVLGARLLGTAVREYTAALTFLRAGPVPAWEARLVDGTVERFVFPDREGELRAALAGAEERLRAAEAALRAGEAAFAAAQGGAGLLDADRGDPVAWGATVARLEVKAAEVTERRDGARTALLAAGEVPTWLDRPGWGWRLLAFLLGWIWAARRDTRDRAHQDELDADTCLTDVSIRLAAARACVAAEDALRAARLGRDEAAAAREAFLTARRERFAADLAALTDLGARGAEVARLDVTWPSPILPPGLVLVDTPGVNTHDAERVRRAWEAVEAHADGCLLLTDLTQAASRTTLAFAQRVVERVPHLLLVFTRADKALADVVVDDPAEADAEVAAAVRGAVRRFAEAVERPAAEVGAYVTAAEPALREEEAGAPGPAVAALGVQLDAVFRRLQDERAVMQARRAAGLAREALAGIDAVVDAAAGACEARLAAITAQAIPEPEAWRRDALDAAHAALAAATGRAAEASHERLTEGLVAARAVVLAELAAIHDVASLKAWSEALDGRLPELVTALAHAEAPRLAAAVTDGAGEARMGALADLDRRYRLVRDVVSTALVPGARVEAGAAAPELVVGAVLPRLVQADFAPTLAGAGTGAIVGSLIVPGVGTLVGAVVGALVGMFAGTEAQKEQVRSGVRAWFDRISPALDGWAEARAEALRHAAETELDAAVDAELARFGAWIADRLAEQQAAIVATRARLAALGEDRVALGAARAELEALLRRGTDAAAG